MSELAPELLSAIGTHLVLDTSDRRSQAALGVLCRVSKAFRDVFTPLLYRRPVIRKAQKVGRWVQTVEAASELVQGRYKERAKSVQPEQLDLRLPSSSSGLRPTEFESFIFRTRGRSKATPLPRLTKALSIRLFDKLTILKLVNVFASHAFLPAVLGPGKPLRGTLRHFALYSSGLEDVVPADELHFLFEGLNFLAATKPDAVWGLTDLPLYKERFEADEDQDVVFKAICTDAQQDYTLFPPIWKEVMEDCDGLEGLVAHAKPTELSPRKSLHTLSIQVMSSEAVCLIFHSPSFPALRRLTLYGQTSEFPSIERYMCLTFRIAVHSLDTPGILVPPEMEWFDSPDSDYEPRGWDAPTPQELEHYQHKPYRGPKLEVLDMSRFTVMLPW
ncbi:hypothetical protein JCM10213_005649 [Rhodosporidiobolus nylandii]